MLRLQVPAPLFLFLHCLARHCDRSAKPLGKFLARISASQLADEIVRDLLPAEFSEVRSELERLQAEKEAAVANAEFQHAAALRDQTDLLKRRVQQACPNAIDIQPDHFVQAIARLGYDQPITI